MKKPLLIFFVFLLFLSACEIKEFSMPVWDVDLKVPLINERYFVSELVDSTHIMMGENEMLFFSTQGAFSTDPIFGISMNPQINRQDIPLISGIELEEKLPLADSDENISLSYGELQSGTLHYRFKNMHPSTGQLCISLPDITKANGEVFTIIFEDEQSHSRNLAGYHIGVRDSEICLDSLRVEISCESGLPLGTFIGLLDFRMDEQLEFSLFQGRINHLEIGSEDSVNEIDIDYPFGLDQAITLHEARVEIEVENELCFDCEFQGFLEAERAGEMPQRIDIVDDNGQFYRIPGARGDENGRRTIVLHDGISELLQIMPEHISVKGVKFIIDQASGFGCLSADHIIKADYYINAPFRFYLHEHPFEIDEVLELEIDEDTAEMIDENLLSAALELKLKNKLPIGGWAHLYFGETEDIDTNDPSSYSFVKSVTLKSSLITDDWQEIDTLTLNETELKLFTNEMAYAKLAFSFEESSQMVEIHASTADYIAIKGSLVARIRVDVELEEEE